MSLQVGRELFVSKRARVAIRADFDVAAAFGARARFDFIVAQSVLSHATRALARLALRRLLGALARPRGRLLATFKVDDDDDGDGDGRVGRGARDDAADEARFAHGEAAAWLQFSIFRVPRRAVEELVREAAAPARVFTAWIAGYHDAQTWLLVTFDEATADDVRGAGAADLRRLNTTNNI